MAASAIVAPGVMLNISVLMTSRIVAIAPPTVETSSRAPARIALIEWDRAHRVPYPWRRTQSDPYATLVSEVMLQQTQASRVVDAFPAFLALFPTVGDLAAASRADVITAWGGLGYPRRAVALHETARIVVRDHEGELPCDPAELRSLPGVGPYTADAVASIAFGVPVAAVDTNVRKVVARLDYGLERDEVTPSQAASSAEAWLDRERPGEWTQAMMNLGREVCRTSPRCHECPMSTWCRFRKAGRAGRASVRRHPAFEGSLRQARGAVLASLRARRRATVSALSADTELPIERVAAAVEGLSADGIVVASIAAISGRPRGLVRLPEA